jgi:hypothetical protein
MVMANTGTGTGQVVTPGGGANVLLHQVHPVKLAADIAASAVSDLLLWHRRPRPAIAVRILLPLAGSSAVLQFAAGPKPSPEKG